MLMGSDSPPAYYEPMKGFSVTLNVKEPEQAERVFDALADRGSVRMALTETFWAKKFRDAHGQIRHAVDDQLRESGLTT